MIASDTSRLATLDMARQRRRETTVAGEEGDGQAVPQQRGSQPLW
jgi:hypothetical protein